MTSEFPSSFIWGAATAAYQVEGGAAQGGRGASIWDMLCDKPGAIYGGHDGTVASDHYGRWKQDVALFRQLGLSGYRFSISWPRVLPSGVGQPNPEGLAFYDRLVDALLEAGITPYVTLFHWDLPLDLYHRGGWLNRQVADWFADYATLMVRTLGDRVSSWLTLNEPQVFIGHGHFDGRHAPGLQMSMSEMLRCGHNALLAHGQAVRAIRAESRGPARVGFAPMGFPKLPASAAAADVAAARELMFSLPQATHWNLTWWADPVILGRYPEDGLRVFGKSAPQATAAELDIISTPTDFLGLNIYQGSVVRAGADGKPELVATPQGFALTAFNWPVTPEALYWGPRFAHERYQKPILITENGLSCRDWPSLDGRVHDAQRVDFLTRHLRQLHRAVSDGVPVEGYFHWSALDNFEWADGYKERFGLIYVDYATGERIPKDSYHWYAKIIASRGRAALDDESALGAHRLAFDAEHQAALEALKA
ncbi:MAG TPA: GH1 family beta-glucosidase [Polyangiaceae bacterium]|nr:GH1 family beta-glucosidase [Polyangiaceae bacterium]